MSKREQEALALGSPIPITWSLPINRPQKAGFSPEQMWGGSCAAMRPGNLRRSGEHELVGKEVEMAFWVSLVGGVSSANVSWGHVKQLMAGFSDDEQRILNGDARKSRLRLI